MSVPKNSCIGMNNNYHVQLLTKVRDVKEYSKIRCFGFNTYYLIIIILIQQLTIVRDVDRSP